MGREHAESSRRPAPAGCETAAAWRAMSGKNSLEDITDTDNPAGVEAGVLRNEGNDTENSCGALSTVITLEPGESREMAFLAGMKEDNEAAEIIAHYADCEKTCAVDLKN